MTEGGYTWPYCNSSCSKHLSAVALRKHKCLCVAVDRWELTHTYTNSKVRNAFFFCVSNRSDLKLHLFPYRPILHMSNKFRETQLQTTHKAKIIVSLVDVNIYCWIVENIGWSGGQMLGLFWRYTGR